MGLVSKTFGEVVNNFSRTSSATYFDSNKVLQTAASGVPRFTYDQVTGESLGLMIERTSTNMLLYSDDWTQGTSGAGWVTGAGFFINRPVGDHPNRPGVNVNYFGPTAGSTSFSNTVPNQIITNLPIGTYYIYQDLKAIPGSVGVNTARFLPVPLAASDGTGQLGGVLYLTGAGGVRLDNFVAGDCFASQEMGSYPIGNGWYRCWIKFTTTKIIPNFRATRTFPYNEGSAVTGDGVAGLHGTMIQLEPYAYPSSYIPTGASTVTRANEYVYRVMGGEFNPNEGTVFADFVCKSLDLSYNSTASLVRTPSPPATDRNTLSLSIDTRPALARVSLIRWYRAASRSVSTPNMSNPAGSRVKAAYTYSRTTGLCTLVVNGGTPITMPFDEPDLFASGINAFMVTGLRDFGDNTMDASTIYRQRYYPRALSQAELITMTT